MQLHGLSKRPRATMADLKGVLHELDREYPRTLSRLTLLGTVHRDPDGYRRTMDFLERLQPDAILLEMSPYAVAYRKSHGRALVEAFRRNLREASEACGLPLREALRHPEVAAIRRQLALPFEYRAASAHARVRSRNAKLFLVDQSSFSWRMIASWPELIAAENLRVLLSAGRAPTPPIGQTYMRALREIHGEDCSPAGGHELLFDKFAKSGEYVHMRAMDETDKLWLRRERFLAAQIRRILLYLRPERPIYIGGRQHLMPCGEPPTLRTILGVHPSRCRLLHEGKAARATGHPEMQ